MKVSDGIRKVLVGTRKAFRIRIGMKSNGDMKLSDGIRKVSYSVKKVFNDVMYM